MNGMNQGGLLGAYAGMGQPAQAAPAQPQGDQNQVYMQMAQTLLQSPTAQTAQQIVQQMKQAGMPEAQQIEEAFMQTGGDPAKLKQIAEAVMQGLSGQ